VEIERHHYPIPLVDGLPALNQITFNWTYDFSFPHSTPSISSNGTAAGTGILWAIDSSQFGSPGPGPGPAVLYAMDPTNISSHLWDSTQAPGNRDTAGNAVKFAVPTVVNGKVYVGTSASVSVYGLLPAVLTAPAPGSTLAGSSATFTWSTVSAPAQYELWLSAVGVGLSDLYNSGSLTSTTINVTGLPTNGVKIYARLWSVISGKWKSNDYTYTESGTPSQGALISPAPGTLLAGSNVTFSWTAGAGPTAYELWLSSVGVGFSDLFNSGSLTSTTTSVNVTGLPANGVTIYARLWSAIKGKWQSTDYTYTESGSPSQGTLTSPAPGSQLTAANVTFSWTPGAGPAAYELWLSSVGVGLSELFNSGSLTSTTTAVSVTGLPTNGVKVYARLWSAINGKWQSTDYAYIEAGTPTQGTLSSPAPGSQLTGANVTFSWAPGAGPVAYELWLSSVRFGLSDLFNSGSLTSTTTSVNVTGLPTNGVKIYAQLWSAINGKWQSTDYTYTEAGTPAPATLSAPTPGSQLAGSSATFSWTPGTGVTAYELWLGSTGVNTNNLYNSGSMTGTSVNVTNLPTNGVTIYIRLWSFISGLWQPTDYKITEAGMPAMASLTSPAPGNQLPGPNVTFTWTAGSGPIAYELWLGSEGLGSSDLYNSGSTTSTFANVTGLPANGAPVYARLWSLISGAWQSTDYTYVEQ
jgi:hypothetical protein